MSGGADWSRTCEGCAHIRAEPAAKNGTWYRCFAPGPRCGYVMSDNAERFFPYVPAWYPGKEEERGTEGQRSDGLCAVYEGRREVRADSGPAGSDAGGGGRNRAAHVGRNAGNPRNNKRKAGETLALPEQETLY